MGWDGTGYRVTSIDADTIERMGSAPAHRWIVDIFLARRRVIWDWMSRNGLVEGRVCWDDLPPNRFGRIRRLVNGQPMIVPVTDAANAAFGPVPEAIWSAIEGGRPVVTAQDAEMMARIEEEFLNRALPHDRRFGEIRGRVIQHGCLEQGMFIGDTEPLVLRECLITDTQIWGNLFENVIFIECDFSRSSFGSNVFKNCQIINCFFDETTWGYWTKGHRDLRGTRGDPDKSPEVIVKRANSLRVDWDAMNTTIGVTIRGDGVSVRGASGVGAALFMPGPLARHFESLAAQMRKIAHVRWDEVDALNAPEGAARHDVRLSEIEDVFTEYRRAVGASQWRVGRGEVATPRDAGMVLHPADLDPVLKLVELREHGGDSDVLRGFTYATEDAALEEEESDADPSPPPLS